MSCCGQKRQQWQQRTLYNQDPVSANADPVLENPVHIQYSGRNTFMVKGRQTGYLYIFAAGEKALAIDGRDVKEILSVSEKFSISGKFEKQGPR